MLLNLCFKLLIVSFNVFILNSHVWPRTNYRTETVIDIHYDNKSQWHNEGSSQHFVPLKEPFNEEKIQ
jgi:hypothetical protein